MNMNRRRNILENYELRNNNHEGVEDVELVTTLYVYPSQTSVPPSPLSATLHSI